MSYIFVIDYDCVWEAKVYLKRDDASTAFTDEGNGNSDIIIYSNACCENLEIVPSAFLPSQRAIFDKKISIKHDKLNSEDFTKCETNSIHPNEAFKTISNRIPTEISEDWAWMPRSEYKDYESFYLTRKYRCDAGKGFDYKISNIELSAILVPVYIIEYSYNSQKYRVAVNGHEFGQSGLFNKDGSVFGAYPNDETKTKGLFNKISASKEKKNYKKETRSKFEQKILADLHI